MEASMLVMTVQVWPYGDPAEARNVAAVAVGNVADLDDGRCEYVAVATDDGFAPAAGCRVEHARDDGPLALLARVLATATPEGIEALTADERATLEKTASTATHDPPPTGRVRRELEGIAEYARRQIDHAEEVGWESQARTWFHVLSRANRALGDPQD